MDTVNYRQGTILEKEQYRYLYWASHMALASFLYALYNAQYRIAIIPASVFTSSIIYWQKPDYSWRRYLDMTVCKVGIIYQHYLAYGSEHAAIYYTIMTLAMVVYAIGLRSYGEKRYWESTWIHLIFHIIANTGNFVLYGSRLRSA